LLKHYYRLPLSSPPPPPLECDLCIYGASAAGVAAAAAARRLGLRVALCEFGPNVGGMPANGLCAAETGRKECVGGVAREFLRRVGRRYGREETWSFEPSVAAETMLELARETETQVFLKARLKAVRKEGARIAEALFENGLAVRAKFFIDAGYEGDLMNRAGVGYFVGRESNETYGETRNGIQFGGSEDNFKVPVDPYLEPGRPNSGLLPGVFPAELREPGSGDHRIQAYCFRLCLTDAPDNRLPFPKPSRYDPARYTLLARYLHAGVWDALRLSPNLPNRKCSPAARGAVSLANLGLNYDWPDANYAVRERVFQDHVTYQQGLLWFLVNDERVPKAVREEVGAWGLCRDEFTETGGWPPLLHVTEARRMLGEYVMTEQDCVGRRRAPEPVGLASCALGAGPCQRVERNGRVENEGQVEQGGFAPFGVSFRSLTPRREECENLLVPVCLSASHVALGAIRREPALMVLGQSAAVAAHLALESGTPVQKIEYRELRERLLKSGQVLECPPPAKET
jgi:hypothetical protein